MHMAGSVALIRCTARTIDIGDFQHLPFTGIEAVRMSHGVFVASSTGREYCRVQWRMTWAQLLGPLPITPGGEEIISVATPLS